MNYTQESLHNLISISDNTSRVELYNGFYNMLKESTPDKKNDILKSMYRNFSGLIAYAELSQTEYKVLLSLLQHLEAKDK